MFIYITFFLSTYFSKKIKLKTLLFAYCRVEYAFIIVKVNF